MKDNFSFILSGIIAFSFYGFLCFLLFFYIASPESKTLDLKSTATTIELDMITEIAEKDILLFRFEINKSKKQFIPHKEWLGEDFFIELQKTKQQFCNHSKCRLIYFLYEIDI